MALTTTISRKELERQAAAAFEGQTYTVFLANNTTGLTAESTASAWLAIEVSGGGYAAVTGTVGTGAYSTGNARYELPAITAAFTGSGAGFVYNTICIRIGTESYLHSIATEFPNIAITDGQTKTYVLTLAQDD